MNNLREKLKDPFNTSKLNHPISDGTVTLSNYLSRAGDFKVSRLKPVRVIGDDETDALPSMFRMDRPESAWDARVNPPDRETAPGESVSSHQAARTNGARASSYVAAGLLLSLAGAAAFHFTGPQGKRDGQLPTGVLPQGQPEKRAATQASAAFISFPSARDAEGVQSEVVAPVISREVESEAWADTVETYKRLLMEQRPMPSAEQKQSDSERALGQLEAWMKAKTP